MNLELLTEAELAYVLAHGEDGCREVTARVERAPTPLVSTLGRASVV